MTINVSQVTATINVLKQPTRGEWVTQAIANLDEILLDHSHCERKAAGVAINLMFRYPSHTLLVRKLTAIAREELTLRSSQPMVRKTGYSFR